MAIKVLQTMCTLGRQLRHLLFIIVSLHVFEKTIHMKLVRYFLAWTGLTVLYLLFFSQTRYIKIFTGIRKLNLHA
jgi:uncharacterized protein YybS (DUF2232 family)